VVILQLEGCRLPRAPLQSLAVLSSSSSAYSCIHRWEKKCCRRHAQVTPLYSLVRRILQWPVVAVTFIARERLFVGGLALHRATNNISTVPSGASTSFSGRGMNSQAGQLVKVVFQAELRQPFSSFLLALRSTNLECLSKKAYTHMVVVVVVG
jgi:hypothetical protein